MNIFARRYWWGAVNQAGPHRRIPGGKKSTAFPKMLMIMITGHPLIQRHDTGQEYNVYNTYYIPTFESLFSIILSYLSIDFIFQVVVLVLLARTNEFLTNFIIGMSKFGDFQHVLVSRIENPCSNRTIFILPTVDARKAFLNDITRMRLRGCSNCIHEITHKLNCTQIQPNDHFILRLAVPIQEITIKCWSLLSSSSVTYREWFVVDAKQHATECTGPQKMGDGSTMDNGFAAHVSTLCLTLTKTR